MSLYFLNVGNSLNIKCDEAQIKNVKTAGIKNQGLITFAQRHSVCEITHFHRFNIDVSRQNIWVSFKKTQKKNMFNWQLHAAERIVKLVRQPKKRSN